MQNTTPMGVTAASAEDATFRSFFMGGFESSCHKRPTGERLDLIASTQHDRFAEQDYAALARHGLLTARDGIRWHRIESRPYRYDFSADLPLVRAARRAGVQVIWDICHYGWPDDVSPYEPEFGRRLAGLARAFARLLRDEGDDRPLVVPVNEISFLSWIGGTEGKFPPFTHNRGDELKRCLVRAALECIDAIRDVTPNARICLIDPLVNVVGNPKAPGSECNAEEYRQAQFAAWDMIAGRLAPELGGRADYLDVIGVNYYVHNQWVAGRNGRFKRMLKPTEPGYRPLADMLAELYARYRRPLFIGETGIEGRRRPRWLRHVCDEILRARAANVPVQGVCLYPVVDYPGWLDDRHCPAGLLGYSDAIGERPVFLPLARELKRQQQRLPVPQDQQKAATEAPAQLFGDPEATCA